MADASTDLLIIGAGAVGLAIARKAALAGRDVILVESNDSFGMETSSRNSEVIHAGIYYPDDSLKGQLCVKGAMAMYEFCEARGITTKNYGKLIVATDDSQIEGLEALKEKGERNNVPGLEIISGETLSQKEPNLKAVAALYSPLTGVVDSHGYMVQLEAEAENAGAIIAYQSRFVSAHQSAHQSANGYDVVIDGQGEEMTLSCRQIINAAGHGSFQVSRNIDAMNDASIPPHYIAKGQYFTTTKKPPFSHLIYPMPSGGGLGIHLTIDTQGGARFGPDIQWVDDMDYSVDPNDRDKFHQLVSSYWPDLEPEDLVPAWAGMRPKIYDNGKVFQDFTIHQQSEHGAEGVVALYAIDSPGLTSSLALADHVMALEELK